MGSPRTRQNDARSTGPYGIRKKQSTILDARCPDPPRASLAWPENGNPHDRKSHGQVDRSLLHTSADLSMVAELETE